MSTLYMMVGVPLSGKSQWIDQQNFDWTKTELINADRYIRAQMEDTGDDYTNAFGGIAKQMGDMISADVVMATSKGLDIVWDQTNVSAQLRQHKLGMIPAHYRKVAVVIQTPHIDTLNHRVNTMVDKNFPPELMESMINSFQMPTLEEGFDEIRVV